LLCPGSFITDTLTGGLSTTFKSYAPLK